MADKIPAPVVLIVRSFIVKDERVLVVRRAQTDSYDPSLWEAPGGKLDWGQDLGAALKREVAEETGLQIKPIDSIVYSTSKIMAGGRYDGRTGVTLFGLSTVVGGELRLSEEHDDYRWCTHAELMKLTLTAETREAEAALRDRLREADAR